MPTIKPRIAVIVNAATLEALTDLAELQKRPRAAVAADLLEEMQPMLTRLVSVLAAAKKAERAYPAAAIGRLEQMERSLGAVAGHAMDELADVVGAANGPSDQRAAGRRRRRKH
jgi:hypothetical protein